MSMLGAFASGIAGGAQAIANQAGGDIDKANKLDIAQQTANIQEQMQLRMEATREANRQAGKTWDTNYDNSAGVVGMRAATANTLATAAGQTARTVEADRLGDTKLTALQRAKIIGDADSLHNANISQTIADSGNPALMKALADLERNNPAKAAEIGLKNAQAQEARQKGGYWERGGAAAGRVGSTAGKLDHDLSESAKIEYTSLLAEAKRAMEGQAKFEIEGATHDANSKPTQQYKLVQENVLSALRRVNGFKMKNGLIDPAELATQAISGQNDTAVIGDAIAKAYSQGGTDFGNKFYDTVFKSGVLERNAESSTNKTIPPKKSGITRMLNIGSAPDTDSPNSPAGKQKARLESMRQQAANDINIKTQQATVAFGSLTDANSANELQQGPLFSYLTLEQKRSVYKMVNER